MDKKKVCIICSLGAKEVCEKAAGTFENLGMEVHHPFLDQQGSLLRIQSNYLKAIEESDIVLVIPKSSTTDNQFNDGTKVTELYGESVSYEMAFALYLNKPIIIWGGGC